ncbi:MAG: DNA-formamidopyrimidine glycosylase family protein, partial [Candidatus Hodarchaeales archaeon]
MPELPEIEAIREYLELNISNALITEIKTYRHTVIRNLPLNKFENMLDGASINKINRIGKILQISLHKLDTKLQLYIDHGLTGRLGWLKDYKRPPAKMVFSLEFHNGKTLIYKDTRLHGAVWLISAKNSQENKPPPVIANFGPDILKISRSEFLDRLDKFRGEIKGILVNKKFVVGIGNAYSDEILYEAKIHPFTKKPQLNEKEKAELFRACQKVLSDAIILITQMLNETQKLDNQNHWRKAIFRVHLKGGEP